jgi:glutamine amidotransferase
MCELFGINSEKKIRCNELLKTFYSHAVEHPDGWGLAVFDNNAVSIEKEPHSAHGSNYLKSRLADDIVEDVLIAHIRKASVGNLSYKNSHPFALRDNSGRLWTLAHNGTIFESPELEPYKASQHGETDSERILYYLVDQINRRQEKKQKPLPMEERFAVAEEVISTITPKNKVNVLVYDNELFYVHTNHRGSLHRLVQGKTMVVSTKPLDERDWEPVPLNTLFAYRRGTLLYEGTPHEHEYIKQITEEAEQGMWI